MTDFLPPPPPTPGVDVPGGPRRWSTGTLMVVAVVSLGTGLVVATALTALAGLGRTTGRQEVAAPTTERPAPSTSTTAGLPDLPDIVPIAPLEHTIDIFGPVGSCVARATYAPISCDEDHEGEVVARIAVDDDAYPGADTLQTRAVVECETRFTELAGETSTEAGLALAGSQPAETAWDDGLRDIICLALSLGGEPNIGPVADGT